MPIASVEIWDSKNAIVLVQPKGFGFPIYPVDPRTMMQALAGGEISYESLYQTNRRSGYVRRIQTSNPGDITGTIMSPYITMTIPQLRKMMTKECPGNIFVLTGCSVLDQVFVSDYKHMFVLGDVFFTNSPLVTSGSLVLGGDPPSAESEDQKVSAAFSAGFGEEGLPLTIEDVSGTTSTGDIVKIISLMRERCAGNCGDEIEIDDEYAFITAAPGGAYDDPELFYTGDKGANWQRNILTGVGDGSGTSLTISGNNLIFGVSGTDAGAYYAALQDVIDGVAVGVEATGVGTQQVNAVKAFGNVVVAVGQAGRVWLSRDGGYSYEVLAATTVVTSENLTGIAGMNQDLIWVFGENGVLLRIRNLQTPTVVTTGITDNILCGATPPLRPAELYLGTDAGDVYVSINVTTSTPTFDTRAFDKPAGGSVVTDIQFGGLKGNTLFLIQTNAGGESRVMVDRSGGNLGGNAVGLGTFTTPGGGGFNTIAPSTLNFAMVGGAVVSTYAAIAKVS